MNGTGQADGIQLKNIRIASRFQLNPRTLPSLAPGRNTLKYRPGAALQRRAIPVQIDRISRFAARADAVRCIFENGQGILWPEEGKTAEVVFELFAPENSSLTGFDVGARFLDLRDGLAPDKFTAETRKTSMGRNGSAIKASPEASIEWSATLSGKYQRLWEYKQALEWRDGNPVEQVLRWPEVDRQIRSLPSGTKKAFVRYRLRGMGMDSLRLAIITPPSMSTSTLAIAHEWYVDGQRKGHVELIDKPMVGREYSIDIPSGKQFANYAVIMWCRPGK
jgi:hypothetical protein